MHCLLNACPLHAFQAANRECLPCGAQEETDAPWEARRQLRLYKTGAKSVGRAWTGPWRTVPAAFAPDKYGAWSLVASLLS